MRIAACLMLLLVACDDGGAAPVDAAPDTIDLDAGALDAATVDATNLDGAPPDAAPPDGPAPDAGPDANRYPDAREWPPRPRPEGTAALDAPGGFRWMGGLIHMHSPHSHDACDGNPQPDGEYDLDCLADLRRGMCHLRRDFLLLTDHASHLTDATFEEALWIGPDDTPVLDGDGNIIANRWDCPDDDHEVWVAAGSESALMPVLLTSMPSAELLGQNGPEAAVALREQHGALVLQSHWEDYEIEELRALRLDGAEIYNLHANVDPNGPYFGPVIRELVAFMEPRYDGGHPDLGILAIMRPHAEALLRWDALLPEQRITGFAGSDIHQNTNLLRTYDGERLDSYRRMGSFFANYALVEEASLDGLRAAFQAGRIVVVFDFMGPPNGFDFHASTDAGRVEMGGDAPVGSTLHFTVDAGDDPLEVTLVHVTAEDSQVLLRTDGAFEHVVDAPGAYRVEVTRTPEHLRAALGVVAELFVRPSIWLYTNPVFVE